MTLKDKSSSILMKVITYLELLEIHQRILRRERKMHLQCSDSLGLPSLFISQSCAKTKWPELLRSLGQPVDNKTYMDQEIESMDW